MYLFRYFLPFLPVEYRRKLSYDILVGYCQLQDGEYDLLADEAKTVKNLYKSTQAYEMNRLEMTGRTNTSINPFEADTYPPL